MYILSYIIPILLNVINLDTTIESIIWLGILLIYVLATLIVPIALIVNTLQEPEEGNAIINISITICMFIINILLTIKAWYMINTITTLIGTLNNGTGDTFVLSLFWISFLASWLLSVIITPIYVITKNLG